MKSLLVVSVGVLLLLVPAALLAGSIGVPVTWSAGEYLVGFEVENNEEEIDGDVLRSNCYMGRIAWRITDPLILSLRIGASEVDVESSIHGSNTIFEGKPKFAFGIGANYSSRELVPNVTAFGGAGVMHLFSNGRTNFTTTIQANTFREEYENTYSWLEYQAGGGLQARLPWASPYAGVAVRALDGDVSRKTYQTGAEVVDETESFSKAFTPYALFGIDIPMPGTFLLSLEAVGRDRSHYSWTIAIAEISH